MKDVDAGDWTIMPELFTVVSREVSGFISRGLRGLCGLLKVLEVSIMFPSIIDMSLLRFTVRTLTATDNCNTELVILRLIDSRVGSGRKGCSVNEENHVVILISNNSYSAQTKTGFSS